jgi:competence protein ComEC
LENTVQKIPFLRLSIALAIGIISGSYFEIPILFILSILILILVFLILVNRNYKYKNILIFGLGIHLLFIFLGVLIFPLHNKKPQFFEKGIFMATILEAPQEKENSYKSVLKLIAFHKNDTVLKTNEKLIVYFGKQETVKSLKPGDNIVFNQSPQTIKNNRNPYEFDYKKYLERKKIYRQLYLPSNAWIKSNGRSSFSLVIQAELLREKLLDIYRKQKLGENEREILSALTLGYKRGLDPETKQVFSAAGAMHVLAVSGLHVGIVFWVILALFGFLKRQKTGRVFFVFLSIFCLWFYAFITGLSPSVARAATMFTFFVVGDNLKRQTNIYNSLAASALILLLVNPNNLFEPGFQLSYSAVFGIVFLQPKLSKLITIKNKIIKYFWTLLTISVAAQITTFPITTYYFDQFPTYFWIANLVIIPAVKILIPLGITLLVFSKITIFSTVVSYIINNLISGIYLLLKQIESLPFAVQEISIKPAGLILILAALFSILLFLNSPRATYLKSTLSFLLLLSVFAFKERFIILKQKEIIVYNNTENTIIHLISGKKNYIISEFDFQENDYAKNLFKDTKSKLQLNPPIFLTQTDTLKDDYLMAKNGILFFEGKTIFINTNQTNTPENMSPDLIINPKRAQNIEKSNSNKTYVVTNKKFIQRNIKLAQPIHQVSKQGAFRMRW